MEALLLSYKYAFVICKKPAGQAMLTSGWKFGSQEQK